MRRKILVSLALLLYCSAANAAPPCDFKGLSVGDKATPKQIMKRFGFDKYKDADEAQKIAHGDVAYQAYLKRAEKVGLINAADEQDFHLGPACGRNYCRIPFGVTVGIESFPIRVGLFIAFDKGGTIEAIDVSYDSLDWGAVLTLLNTKFGDDWRVEETPDITTDLETKKSEQVTVIVLTHKTFGINAKTGDKCSISTTSRDMVYRHSMPPFNRAELEIKLISKNF